MAKKKVGRPAKRAARGGPEATGKQSSAKVAAGQSVRVEIATFRPGLVQALRSDLDLAAASAQPRMLRLSEHGPPPAFTRLEATDLTTCIEAEGDGLFCVKLSGGLLVHPEAEEKGRTRAWTAKERKQLLGSAGEGCEAFLSLYLAGEADELAFGKDILWVKQCAVKVRSAEPASAR